MLGGSSERRSTPTMPEPGLFFSTPSCPVLDTSTTGHRRQDVIGGPDGTLIDEASLVFPHTGGASLGRLPDTSAHVVRGTHIARESEHQSAPGFVDGGALFVPRRGAPASTHPAGPGRTVQFYGLVVDQECRPNVAMGRSNPFDVWCIWSPLNHESTRLLSR